MWACYNKAQLAELNLSGKGGRMGGTHLTAATARLEKEEDHCEIPTT
jgi:hypothetical protein